MKYLIWWLNQADSEAIEETIGRPAGCWPEYIQDQFDSRYGRPGRGRLWVDVSITDRVAVNPWPDTPLGKLLVNGYGGIVIHAADRRYIDQMPGILTDTGLNRV